MDILKNAVEQQGYVLHGSPYKIERLVEPRQAHDETTESGNKVAVYATTNLIVAVFKGLVHRKGNDYQTGWSLETEGEERVFGVNVELKEGYVYIISQRTFKECPEMPSEYFSLEQVPVVERIRVIPEHLYQLQREYRFTIDIR